MPRCLVMQPRHENVKIVHKQMAPRKAKHGCGELCRRHARKVRDVMHVNFEVHRVDFGVYHCLHCKEYFRFRDPSYPVNSHYSAALKKLAIGLMEGGMSIRKVSDKLWEEHGWRIPSTTMHDWRSES